MANNNKRNIKNLKISFQEFFENSAGKVIKFMRDLYNWAFPFWDLFKTNKIAYNAFRITLLLIGLYLVIYPLLPGIIFRILYEGKEIYPYETKLELPGENVEKKDGKIPEENRLVIPNINVNMPIIEGSDEKALDLGVWHRPGTGTPKSGNMVLTGHRFGYSFLSKNVRNKTSFYNLDKLKKGDNVIVYWNKKEYDYKIYDDEIVKEDEMRIESQGVGDRLTLYTCHPLGANSHRLVYYAKGAQSHKP